MLYSFLLHINAVNPNQSQDWAWEQLRNCNNAVLSRDLDRAERYLGDTVNDQRQHILVARGLVQARICTMRGEQELAGKILDEVLPLLDGLASDAHAAWEHRKGVLQRLAGDIDGAIRLQLSACAKYEEANRRLDAAFCVVEIASALLARGDVASATREYLSVVDVVQKHGTELQHVAVKANLAVAMHRAGDLAGAEAQYRQLLDRPPYNVPSSERAVLLQNMAVIAKVGERYDEAIALYNEALSCLSDAAHAARMIRIKCGLADLALRKGQIDEVRKTARELQAVDLRQLHPSTAIELASLQYRLAIADDNYQVARDIIATARRIAADNQLREEHAELLADAVSVLTDRDLRMPLIEELLDIQTERLHAVSTTIATMVEIRTRYEQERAAQERIYLQERAQLVMETQERTMEEIGRDLHDSIGNDLTVARRRIELLQQDLSDLSDVQKARLDELLRSVERASADARRISHMLAVPGLDGASIETAVAELLKSAAESAPAISFTYAVSGMTSRVPPSYVRTAYRCLQSLLQNLMHHAQATTCEVRIGVHKDELVVAIDDNGRGFDPQSVVKGLGLRSVHARVAAHGGRVMLDSSPGRGAFVSLHLPLGHIGDGYASTDSDLSHR